MITRLLIIIPIIVGFSISLPFIISYTSGGTHFTQEIDPRFLEVTNGLAISSNMDIYSVNVEDELPGISIATSKNPDGFIHMNDPLPILQKLFPEKNIVSFSVFIDGLEIPYTLEDENLGISVTNSDLILIVGFFKL